MAYTAHGILQARILGQNIALLQGIFPTQDWTQVSCITGGFFRSWATRKAQKGCINLFYSHVGKDKLSLHELNKGTLVFSQAERQGPPGKAMEYDYNNKSKSKKQFPTWNQNWLSPCNTFRKSLL